jgi:hypothetical protein
MSGIFDRLSQQFSDDDSSGITPLDIADLPTDQRQLMLGLLRDQGGTDAGVPLHVLRTKFGDKIADVEGTLAELSKRRWVILMGEAPNVFYRVNLRAKRGSGEEFGLWSILNDRVSRD